MEHVLNSTGPHAKTSTMVTEVPKDSLPPASEYNFLDFSHILEEQVQTPKDMLIALVRVFSLKVSKCASPKKLWKAESQPEWWSDAFRKAMDKAGEKEKESDSFKYSYDNVWKNPTATTEDSVLILEIKMALLWKHLADEEKIPPEIETLCSLLEKRNQEDSKGKWKGLYMLLCALVHMKKAEVCLMESRILSSNDISDSKDSVLASVSCIQYILQKYMKGLDGTSPSRSQFMSGVSKVQLQETETVDLNTRCSTMGDAASTSRFHTSGAQETCQGLNSGSSVILLGESGTEINLRDFLAKGRSNVFLREGIGFQPPEFDLTALSTDHCMKEPAGLSTQEGVMARTSSTCFQSDQNGQTLGIEHLGLGSKYSVQPAVDTQDQIATSHTSVEEFYPTKEVSHSLVLNQEQKTSGNDLIAEAEKDQVKLADTSSEGIYNVYPDFTLHGQIESANGLAPDTYGSNAAAVNALVADTAESQNDILQIAMHNAGIRVEDEEHGTVQADISEQRTEAERNTGCSAANITSDEQESCNLRAPMHTRLPGRKRIRKRIVTSPGPTSPEKRMFCAGNMSGSLAHNPEKMSNATDSGIKIQPKHKHCSTNQLSIGQQHIPDIPQAADPQRITTPWQVGLLGSHDQDWGTPESVERVHKYIDAKFGT